MKKEIKGQFDTKTYWITEDGIAEFLAKNMALFNDKYIKKGRLPSSGDKEVISDLYKIRDQVMLLRQLFDIDSLDCRISNEGMFLLIEINGRSFQVKEDPVLGSLSEVYAREVEVVQRKRRNI